MKLSLEKFLVFKHHLHMFFQLDDYPFETKIFYPTVDLNALLDQYPADQMQTIYATIAFFEGFKYCLVFPETYDVSAIAGDLPEAVTQAFSDWFPKAWSQHLYENERFDYKGPKIISSQAYKDRVQPCVINTKSDKVLACNGGGKDSFVMMEMLEKASFDYDSYQFGRTEYGKLCTQQHLMDINCTLLKPSQTHHVNVYDDFTDGIFCTTYFPDIKGDSATGNPCQVGTPEGIFETIPVCLAHSIRYVATGNEKSADEGSLYSQDLGHQVNHQWIKSLEAETCFKDLISENLVSDLEYFSLLKPIHDTRIYDFFAGRKDMLPFIHSCNIEKPWCKKCPKCAYVWSNFVAIFDYDSVFDVFHVNLLDDPDLTLSFRQLLGLENRNAFECVGEIHETRLAFKAMYEKGVSGHAMDIFVAEVLNQQDESYWHRIYEQYMAIDQDNHNIPHDLFDRIYGDKVAVSSIMKKA